MNTPCKARVILGAALVIGMLVVRWWMSLSGVALTQCVPALTAHLQSSPPDSLPTIVIGSEPPKQRLQGERWIDEPANRHLSEATAAQLREWENLDDPDRREARSRALEALLNGADFRSVLESLPTTLVNFALGLAPFQRWINDHPQGAAEWMSAHPGDIAAVRVRQMVASWQSTDATGLSSYAVALEDGDWKQTMIAALATQAAANDPQRAIALAGQMEPGDSRTGVLNAVASSWIKLDPEAAMIWAGQLRDRKLSERMAGELATASAEIDPASAAQWAMQSIRPGYALDRCLADVAATWAANEPAAAGAWAAQLPPGRGQRLAIDQIVNVWGTCDPLGAEAWIAGLPEKRLQTRAAALMATLPGASQP